MLMQIKYISLTYGVQAVRLKLADKGTKAVELGSPVGNFLSNFQGDLGAVQLEVPDCWKYVWHVDSQKSFAVTVAGIRCRQ